MAPRRLALKQRNFINEYLKNGGNATRAALEVYDTNAKVARSIGSENLAKPNVRNEIERVLGNGAIEQALAVTLEALYASTADGKPHWGGRLRAADMIFRLGHAYDRKQPEEVQQEPIIELDFSNVHPEITKYVARHGDWPDEETEQRLLDGEVLNEIAADQQL
jgi:hypothetical protein